MAAELLETAELRFLDSEALKRAKRFAYLKPMEKSEHGSIQIHHLFGEGRRTNTTDQSGGR